MRTVQLLLSQTAYGLSDAMWQKNPGLPPSKVERMMEC